MRIGLYGGSFNPAHDGHLPCRHHGAAAPRLDRVWWLVTPGNPLKRRRGRPRRCRALRAGRRHGARRSAHRGRPGSRPRSARASPRHAALAARRRPGVRFVWIMGADNLAGFHHWQGWPRSCGLDAGRGDRPAGLDPAAPPSARAAPALLSAALSPSATPPPWLTCAAGLGLPARAALATSPRRAPRMRGVACASA